jgi:undecaprenyl phosphate N,N'-diacetylbacillosamine 1-phosphate transferase
LYAKFFKRLIDLVVSICAFAALSPVFVGLTLLLWINNNGRPFFTQQRPGKKCRPFYVIKFKTMNDKRDASGVLLPDEQRLTMLGRWIRKTSLDEMPQLINVIKGDMSLVGPRPLLMEYISLYSQTQRIRHEVMPGITGWAQVNGRNAISWSDKFSYDVWYVNNLSLWLDLKIMFITVKKVFKAEGISGQGVATAEKFNGKN